MSTNNSQQTPAETGKTCRCASKASLFIWIVVLLVIGTVLWVCYTPQGQQTFGNILNKGFVSWLTGGGNVQAENEAAAELEKNGATIIKMGDEGVTSLSFSNNLKPGDDLLKQIGKLHRLSSLDLANAEITDDQLVYFGNLNQLTSLLLSGTKISDAGMVHLSGLSSLHSLHAAHTKISDAGLEQIAKLSLLSVLDLSDTNISDQGMKQIAKLKKLIWLVVRGNNITDEGLAELEGMPELTRITFTTDMKISKEALEKLKKALPEIKVDMDKPNVPAEKPAAAALPDAEKQSDSATIKPEDKPEAQ